MNIHEQKEVKALEDEIDKLFDNLKKSIYDVTVARRNWLDKVKGWLGFVGKSPVYRTQYESKKGLTLHQYAEIKGLIGNLEGQLNEVGATDLLGHEYVDDILNAYRDKLKTIVRTHVDAMSRAASTPAPAAPPSVPKPAEPPMPTAARPEEPEKTRLGLRHPRYLELKKARHKIENSKLSPDVKKERYNFIDKELEKYKGYVRFTGEIPGPKELKLPGIRRTGEPDWFKQYKKTWSQKPQFIGAPEEEEAEAEEAEVGPEAPVPLPAAAKPTELPKKEKKKRLPPMSEDEMQKAIKSLEAGEPLSGTSITRLRMALGIKGKIEKHDKEIKKIKAKLAGGEAPVAAPEEAPVAAPEEAPEHEDVIVADKIMAAAKEIKGLVPGDKPTSNEIIKLGSLASYLKGMDMDLLGSKDFMKHAKENASDWDKNNEAQIRNYAALGERILGHMRRPKEESIQSQVDKYKKLLREDYRPELLQRQVAKLPISEKVNFYRAKLASSRDRS